MTGLEWLAIGMLVAFFVLLLAGIPVALTLATVGFVFGFAGFGATLFNLLPARIFGVVANYQWLAIPLFVFMGVMLEKSRLADDLLDVVGHIAGNLRGGMALGIIGVGVLRSACSRCPRSSSAATTRAWPAARSARRGRSARSSRRA
jgi:TRAP-type mannitol/chloroaromatic compound transport system permease large subunit